MSLIRSAGRWLWLPMILALMGVWALTSRSHADEGAGKPTQGDQLSKQIIEKQYDQLVASLRADKSLAGDPAVETLIAEIARYQQHKAQADVASKEACAKALEKMAKCLTEDRLEDALDSAIDAHMLTETFSDDPASFFKDPRIENIVKKSEQAADKAAKDGRWLDALSLYSRLNQLHDEAIHYKDMIKECELHLRILRLYVPKEFQRMVAERVKARAARNAADSDGKEPKKEKNDEDEPNVVTETWDNELKGIDLDIFRRSVLMAQTFHVSKPTFQKLLLGSLDDLAAFAQAKQLASEFPGFKDAKKVKAFADGIEKLHKDLAARTDRMNYDDAKKDVLDKVVELNGSSLGLPENVLTYELTEGAMSTLDDFTSVIWPAAMKDFLRSTRGEFSGVGIQISRREGKLLVIAPISGTPAQKAGIKPGDFIVSVNGESTAGWTIELAVKRITGEKGTPVTLGIERQGHKDPLSFKLTRATIPVESIKGWEPKPDGKWNYYLDREQKIGYIRLTNFHEDTVADLDRAIKTLKDDNGLNGLVLDLRGNPGGLLKAAEEVSNRFIKSGVLVSTVDGDNKVRSETKAQPNKAYEYFPLVVLVNGGSASASEIVSGALQDNNRATIIGTRTFGKGSVQNVVPFPEREYENPDWIFKLTQQYYRLPSTRILHRKPDSDKWGVDPEVKVKLTYKQLEELYMARQNADIYRDANDPPATQPATTAAQLIKDGMDLQLEAALIVLRTKLIAEHHSVAHKPEPASTP